MTLDLTPEQARLLLVLVGEARARHDRTWERNYHTLSPDARSFMRQEFATYNALFYILCDLVGKT